MRRGGHPGEGAVTRAEFLVAVLVILGLAALLTPVLRETYESSLTLRCRQHLTEIFTAVQNYSQNFNGYPPCEDVPMGRVRASRWREVLDPYLQPLGQADEAGLSKVWTCPVGGPYVGNIHVFGPPYGPLGALRLASEIGAVADGKPDFDLDAACDSRGIAWRHHGGANVIFLDRHVEWVASGKAERMRRLWDNPQ